MSREIPFFPLQEHGFLPDPAGDTNESRVFVKAQASTELSSRDRVVRYMRESLPSPIRLRMMPRESHLSVMAVASENPRIVVGCGRPSGDVEADSAEIIRVLKVNGLTAVYAA